MKASGGDEGEALGRGATPRVGDGVSVAQVGVLAAMLALGDVLILSGEEPWVRDTRALEQRERAVSVQLGLRVERGEPEPTRGGAVGRRLGQRRNQQQRA